MKLVSRKTRKAIRKSVSKVIRKQGPVIAAGLVGSIASTLATLAKTEAPESRGKSNLAKLSEDVSDKLTGSTDERIRDSSSDEPAKKKKHYDSAAEREEDVFAQVR
jgi:hypothetical protein